MPLYLTEDDVRELLTPREVTDALQAAFRALHGGRAAQEPRVRVRHGRHVLHNLPAISEADGMAGIKSYLSGPKGVRFVTMLFGLDTGALEAVVESSRLGQLRTGCATALAARFLRPPGEAVLGLVGTGTVAWGQLEALAAEVPLARVNVFSRSAEARTRFCERALAELAIQARPRGSAAEAVENATLVVTATTSKDPFLTADMLPKVCHVSAVGSNQAARREVAGDVVLSSGLVVVDDPRQARIEAGDLLAVEDLDWMGLVTLADLVANPPADRPDRTFFKSLGVGLEDVATASLALRKARERGAGRELEG